MRSTEEKHVHQRQQNTNSKIIRFRSSKGAPKTGFRSIPPPKKKKNKTHQPEPIIIRSELRTKNSNQYSSSLPMHCIKRDEVPASRPIQPKPQSIFPPSNRTPVPSNLLHPTHFTRRLSSTHSIYRIVRTWTRFEIVLIVRPRITARG